jgi:hypothetical protein
VSEPFEIFREPTLLDGGDEPSDVDSDPLRTLWMDEFVEAQSDVIEALPVEYGGDRAWLAYGLRVLAKRRALGDDSSTGDVACVLLDLCVLSALTAEFHNVLDSGKSGDWRYKYWGDVAGLGGLDPMSLGRALERENIVAAYGWYDPASAGDEVKEYIETCWSRVRDDLTDEVGDNGLMVGLWGARDGVETPLDDDCWDILNAPTSDAIVAWEWLTAGAYMG